MRLNPGNCASLLAPGRCASDEVAAVQIGDFAFADDLLHRMPDLFPGCTAANVVHLQVQMKQTKLKENLIMK